MKDAVHQKILRSSGNYWPSIEQLFISINKNAFNTSRNLES